MIATSDQVCSAFTYTVRVESLIGSQWTNEGSFQEREAEQAKELLQRLRQSRPERKYRLIAMAFEVIEV